MAEMGVFRFLQNLGASSVHLLRGLRVIHVFSYNACETQHYVILTL